MKCPFCATLDSKVVDSRPANDGTSIRRRRECLKCHNRFTTYETIEVLPMIVIKKNGIRQAFDRSKLMTSMLKACEKRSVSLSLLEKAESCGTDFTAELAAYRAAYTRLQQLLAETAAAETEAMQALAEQLAA